MTDAAADRPRFQCPVVLVGGAILALGLWRVAEHGWRMPVLLVIGALLGLVLYHAAFGFTAAYRRLILSGDTRAVAAQVAMLALATILFAPTLAEGTILGVKISGAAAPLGLQVVVGAFLFGIGMQLGNGCGSGTLFTLGGGSTRMIATLIFFCGGSFWASLHMQWWNATPRLGTIVLGETFGWSIALVGQLALLGLLWLALRRWGRSLGGGWPFLWGGIGLAVLNWLTLVFAGHAWSITWGFSLWGAKTARALGWDPAGSWFWTGGYQEWALKHELFADTVSVMNIGLVLGALIAAGLAGRYAPTLRLPARSLLAAAIGGLLMGYGARIAFGCNIGAFFSGVASTSLHGWLWFLAAFAGTWLGVRWRPWFGLENE